MSRAIRALIWEQWRLSRWALLPALAAPTALWLVYWANSDDKTVVSESLVELFASFTGLAAIGLALYLVFWHGDPHNLRSPIPPWHFVLPVRTHVLAATIFLTRLAIVILHVCLAAAIYVLLCVAVSGMPKGEWPSFFLTLGAVAAGFTVYLQGWAWLLPGARSIAAVVATAYVLAWTPWGREGVIGWPNWLVSLAFVVSVGCMTGFAGVWFQRHGMEPRFRSLVLAFLAPRPRTAHGSWRFSTPFRAQVWFEWRRFGQYLPLLTCMFILFAGCTAVLVVGPERLFLETHGRTVLRDVPAGAGHAHTLFSFGESQREVAWLRLAKALALAGLTISVQASFVTGLLVASQDQRERASGMSAFAMIRPLSTRAQAWARMAATGLGVIVSVGPFVVLVLGSMRETDLSELILRAHQPPATLPLTLVEFAGLAWVLSTIAVPFTIVSVPLAAITAIFVDAVYPWPIGTDLGTWVVIAAVCVAMLSFFGLAYRRRLLRPRDALWLLPAWLLLVYDGLMLPGRGEPAASHTVLAVAYRASIAVVPLLPFAIVPLWLHRLRHR